MPGHTEAVSTNQVHAVLSRRPPWTTSLLTTCQDNTGQISSRASVCLYVCLVSIASVCLSCTHSLCLSCIHSLCLSVLYPRASVYLSCIHSFCQSVCLVSHLTVNRDLQSLSFKGRRNSKVNGNAGHLVKIMKALREQAQSGSLGRIGSSEGPWISQCRQANPSTLDFRICHAKETWVL